MEVSALRTAAISAVLLSFSVFAPAVWADTTADYTYTLAADGSAVITGYEGTDTALVLPTTLGGAKVTEIGENAFARNQSLTSVTIPEGVTEIGAFAFNDCSGLTQVTLPGSLVSVGEGAFFSCTRLTEVELPDALQNLGDSAFYYCKALKTITLPDSVTQLGIHAFSECTALTEARIGSGLNELPAQTFYGCTQLQTVTLPDTMTEIGDRAFVNCASLEKLKLPAGLQRIGDYAFRYSGIQKLSLRCEEIGEGAFSDCALGEITLGDGVRTIGEKAFAGSQLQTLSIPATVTKIGLPMLDASAEYGLTEYSVDPKNPYYTAVDGALYNKSKTELLSVPLLWEQNGGVFTVPAGVTKIDDYAFFGCYNIREVRLPDSVVSLGSNAFGFCGALTKINIPAGVATLKQDTFQWCSSLTDVTLSEGVQTIEDGAFTKCGSLTGLTLPDSVTSITAAAFADCTQPIVLAVSDDNPNYVWSDGALYTKNQQALAAYLGAEENFRVPDGVTELGPHAIVCPATKSVKLPVGITKLGQYAAGFDGHTDAESHTENFILYTDAADTGTAVMDYALKSEVACFTGEPKVNADSFRLKAGESTVFSVANAPAQLMQYASSDNTVATVDNSGRITAVASGSAEIYAVVGQQYFAAVVTVSGGSAPKSPYADYRTFADEAAIDGWLPQYQAYNSGFSLAAEDNANIVNYSSHNYAYILACQSENSPYKKRAVADYGENGYGQFRTVGENLHWEADRYTLSDNVVSYSGTDDVSAITGAGSSLADILNSVGKVVTTKQFTSTSLLHEVADNFATGAHPIVLEFYVPKDYAGAAYIAPISEYSNEYELFLNDGVKFKVVDAGVRSCAGSDKPEWYLKLAVAGTPTPTPTPAPTAKPTPTATPKPTAAPGTPTPAPTVAPTATPDDSQFFTCSRCGYHDWTAVAEGYRCDHCGAVTTQQLNGYPNVKGYTDTAALTKTPDATPAPAASGSTPAAESRAAATAAPTAAPTEVPAETPEPTAAAEPAVTPAPVQEPEAARAGLPVGAIALLAAAAVGIGAVVIVRVRKSSRSEKHYHHKQ